MDYGRLIQRSWQLTWRHRFLWVLGLFVPGVGGGGNGGSGFNIPSIPDTDRTPGAPGGGRVTPPTGFDRTMADVGRWIEQNLWLIILIALLVLLLLLVLFVVSFIARGGMARATAALARGEPITAGQAWRAGLGLFWRYLGLWGLEVLIGLAVLIALGLLVGLLVLIGAVVGEGPRVALIVLGVLLAIPLVFLLLLGIIVLSIADAYGQRAIAVDDQGPVTALGTGFRLLRQHLGTTALTWLINVAVSLGASIVIVIGLFVLAIPLVLAGVALYMAAGLSGGLIGYGAVALLLVIAGVWFLTAIANTYVWNYWTLAYLALTGRLTAQLEPVPA